MLTKDLLLQINQALNNDESVVVLTVLETTDPAAVAVGAKRLVRADGTIIGSLGVPALDTALDHELIFQTSQRHSDTLTIWSDQLKAPENAEFITQVQTGAWPRVRVLIERLRPQPCLLICGAGHIARALTQLGLILGFRAIVIDDRAEFAHRNYFPDSRVELVAQPFEQALNGLTVSASMAVVIVTRGHKHDEDCLRLLLKTPANYLGMIGSRRRVTVVKERLLSEGFSDSEIGRLYAPIGLNIGARTPEEIALAILAEIILIRNRGRDQFDSNPMSRPVKSARKTE